MVSQEIVFATHMQPFAESAVQRAALAAVMNETLFNESSCFPALRPGAQDRDQIDSARSYRWIATDGLEAFASEHLTHARDMLEADEFIVVVWVSFFFEGRATYTQSWIFRKALHEK